MIESEWFFYGSPSQNPHANHPHSQLGLYNPVIDRIVVVFDNEEVLRRISVCWSSRCQLVLCELGAAENFTVNLIDNSCCMNWTISDKQKLQWTQFPDFDRPPFMVRELIQKSCEVDQSDILVENLEYLWASITWLWIEKNQNIRKHHVVPKYMTDSLELPCPPPQNSDLASGIENIIYTEFDFAQARIKIAKLFAEYDHFDFTKINLRINGIRNRALFR